MKQPRSYVEQSYCCNKLSLKHIIDDLFHKANSLQLCGFRLTTSIRQLLPKAV